MDTLSFIASLVGSLAWPATVIVIVVLLRREIVAMLPFLRKLKAGPLEAEFEREVKELKSETETALPPSEPKELGYKWKQALELAQINPRAAILDAWQNVEFAARRALLNHAGSPIPDMRSTISVIKELTQMNLLTQEQVGLFHDLRGLRNQATHSEDFNPSLDSAMNYVQLAASLESHFEKLAS